MMVRAEAHSGIFTDPDPIQRHDSACPGKTKQRLCSESELVKSFGRNDRSSEFCQESWTFELVEFFWVPSRLIALQSENVISFMFWPECDHRGKKNMKTSEARPKHFQPETFLVSLYRLRRLICVLAFSYKRCFCRMRWNANIEINLVTQIYLLLFLCCKESVWFVNNLRFFISIFRIDYPPRSVGFSGSSKQPDCSKKDGCLGGWGGGVLVLAPLLWQTGGLLTGFAWFDLSTSRRLGLAWSHLVCRVQEKDWS